MSDTRSLAEALRPAADAVRRCRDAPAAQAKETFGQAMLQVIRARNERLRDSSAREQQRRLNAILSLMASIEFPLGGFHRERLEQVVQALHALDDGAAAGQAERAASP